MAILTTVLTRILRAARTEPAWVAPPQPVLRLRRLSIEDQIARLYGMVSNSLDRVRVSGECQEEAERQIDAAAYALRDIIQDLSTVMTLPDPASNAELHQLRRPAGSVVLARRRVAAAA